MASETDITRSEELHLEGAEELSELPALALEHTEKGSIRSMWELLMQLRVLLPYLTRLVPMLDRGLLKATPDLTDIRKGIEEISSGNRGLDNQFRSHSLQLERMEEHLLRLREMGEQSRKQVSDLTAEIRSLGRRVSALLVLAAIVLVGLIAVVALQAIHFAR